MEKGSGGRTHLLEKPSMSLIFMIQEFVAVTLDRLTGFVNFSRLASERMCFLILKCLEIYTVVC